MTSTRRETDSIGAIDVATDRYWGAQTERSLNNFRIGTDKQPIAVIHALATVKKAAARVNQATASSRPSSPTRSSRPPTR